MDVDEYAGLSAVIFFLDDPLTNLVNLSELYGLYQ
jgi:hypothetical protein